MNAQEIQQFKSQIRRHLQIFAVLLAGTVISVGVALSIDSVTAKIAVALSIAAIQAALIAGVLMHLGTERKSIPTILAVTGVLFLGLGALTIWASQDSPDMTRHLQSPGKSAPAHHVP